MVHLEFDICGVSSRRYERHISHITVLPVNSECLNHTWKHEAASTDAGVSEAATEHGWCQIPRWGAGLDGDSLRGVTEEIPRGWSFPWELHVGFLEGNTLVEFG